MKTIIATALMMFFVLMLVNMLSCEQNDSDPVSAGSEGSGYHIDLDVSNIGYDVGGGSWELEVSARVTGAGGNPVSDNIPINLSVYPEIATIENALTGNESRNSETAPGVAYALLIYNSTVTFDTIEIRAAAPGLGPDVMTDKAFVLPLNDTWGEVTLYLDRENFMFEEGADTARIRCWVTVKDGHDVLVNNAPVLFSSNRGQFFWFNYATEAYEPFVDNVVRKYTGWKPPLHEKHQEATGQATVYLVVAEDDIFLDPYTLESIVQIKALIEGFDNYQADPKFVFFTRISNN